MKAPGVKDVAVDYDAGTATVTAEAGTDAKTIAAALTGDYSGKAR